MITESLGLCNNLKSQLFLYSNASIETVTSSSDIPRKEISVPGTRKTKASVQETQAVVYSSKAETNGRSTVSHLFQIANASLRRKNARFLTKVFSSILLHTCSGSTIINFNEDTK